MMYNNVRILNRHSLKEAASGVMPYLISAFNWRSAVVCDGERWNDLKNSLRDPTPREMQWLNGLRRYDKGRNI